MKYSALSFDGVDDYIEIPDISFTGGVVTFEVLFKANITTFHRTILSYLGRDSAPWAAAILKIWEGNICYFLGFADGTSTGSVVVQAAEVGVLYRYILTYDGATARAYVNGYLKRTDTYGKALSVISTPSFVGRDRPGGAEWFGGAVVFVRIFGRVLTEEECKYGSLSRDGLVLEYTPKSFNTKAGRCYDFSGKGSHGTIIGASLTTELYHLPPMRIIKV